MRKCRSYSCFCTGKCVGIEESKIIWTGPSVRVKDGFELLDSEELKRDSEAAKKLAELHRTRND